MYIPNLAEHMTYAPVDDCSPTSYQNHVKRGKLKYIPKWKNDRHRMIKISMMAANEYELVEIERRDKEKRGENPKSERSSAKVSKSGG